MISVNTCRAQRATAPAMRAGLSRAQIDPAVTVSFNTAAAQTTGKSINASKT